MKNIVTIGGGTGSYTVLSGLKNLKGVSLTALVNMSDNGGSTGILMDELGVLPSGDIRQCLVALSEHSEIVRELMNYRFTEGGLSGHNFGNIFLAALEKVTGSFDKGVQVASEILKVNGTVVPFTTDKAELCVELSDGSVIKGQVNITSSDLHGLGVKRFFLKDKARINKNAEKALLEADYIIIGPGHYYESLISNFLVKGFKETLARSKAKIILPVNLTNKQEHTMLWKASDYVKNTEIYLGKLVDFILLNNEPPSKEQVELYKLQEGEGVMVKDDLDDPRVIREALLSHLFFKYAQSDARSNIRSFIRHDSEKLARCIEKIIHKSTLKRRR